MEIQVFFAQANETQKRWIFSAIWIQYSSRFRYKSDNSSNKSSYQNVSKLVFYCFRSCGKRIFPFVFHYDFTSSKILFQISLCLSADDPTTPIRPIGVRLRRDEDDFKIDFTSIFKRATQLQDRLSKSLNSLDSQIDSAKKKIQNLSANAVEKAKVQAFRSKTLASQDKLKLITNLQQTKSDYDNIVEKLAVDKKTEINKQINDAQKESLEKLSKAFEEADKKQSTQFETVKKNTDEILAKMNAAWAKVEQLTNEAIKTARDAKK